MANEVVLTFAGDSKQLEQTNASVSTSAGRMSDSVQASSSRIEKSWGNVSSASHFLAEGIGGLGDGIRAITEMKNDAAVRADRLARANSNVAQAAFDVEQAMQSSAQALLDWQQASRDTAQAAIDVEQAQLDLEAAQRDYNEAIKEYGVNSIEARQALIDQKQANEDLEQANLDAKQAEADKTQYLLDGKQATIDATGAQIDLNEARREAVEPTGLQIWTERLSAMAPVALTAVGALQLLTTSSIAATTASGIASAATGVWTGIQWLLNAAFWANPITWIVAGIIALIAVIVLIATKTTWFQDIWDAVWGAIKAAAAAIGAWFSGPFVDYLTAPIKWVMAKAGELWELFKSLPGKLGTAFSGLADIIMWPFRTAFNFVSDAWNNTVGKLSWTVPSWVPMIGGSTISAPKLPKFHDGGTVPGLPGQEILAILQAGERIIPAGQSSSGAGGDTYNVNLAVRLEDLAQLKDLEEFLAMLRNNSRRGLVTV